MGAPVQSQDVGGRGSSKARDRSELLGCFSTKLLGNQRLGLARSALKSANMLLRIADPATKDLTDLEVFRRSTKYLTENLPEDFVPWTDFDNQAVIWRYRDTSAAPLCAYGLLRMSELDPDRELANRDRKFAIRILNSLG